MTRRAGRKSKAQTPAPPKDRIYGSDVNKSGSASSKESGKNIVLSSSIIKQLNGKLQGFKLQHPTIKNITLNDLKAVYRRGLGAYSSSHRPTITGGVPNSRNAWAMARVNKFLRKAAGEKVKKAYVQDDDLMKYEHGGEIKEEAANHGAFVFKYFENNEKIAYLRYYIDKKSAFSIGMDRKPFNYKSELYLDMIEVDEKHRNKGIAKKLIKKVIDKAQAEAIDVITLKRESGMGCAYGSRYDTYLKSLYSSMGFVETWTEEDVKKDEEKNPCAMHLDMKKKYADGGVINDKGLLKTAYPDLKELFKKHGLDLNKEYAFTDGSNKSYVPYMAVQRDGDTVEKIGITYYGDGFEVLGEIEIEVEEDGNVEIEVEFPEWSINEEVQLFKDGGMVLIAPNGKPSNLTPEQYNLVRTPEFKAWFGDWENDPENASKIVDDNGEPMPCYHGSHSKDFYEFDEREIGRTDAGFYGRGFYFVFYPWSPKSARGEASYYGKNIIEAFINAKNPFDISSLSEYKGEKVSFIGAESAVFLMNIAKMFPDHDFYGAYKKTYGKTDKYGGVEVIKTRVSSNEYANLFEKYSDEIQWIDQGDRLLAKHNNEFIDSIELNEINRKNGHYGYELNRAKAILITNALEKLHKIEVSYMPEGLMTRNPQISRLLREKHDGFLQSKQGDELIVFNSSQIKLADGTNTTFNSDNPDIRYKDGGMIKRFYSNCVSYPDISDLDAIIENEKEISRETFVRHVNKDDWSTLLRQLGYTSAFNIDKDWHVSFFKSKDEKGDTVYFLRHSAIEYVFKNEGQGIEDDFYPFEDGGILQHSDFFAEETKKSALRQGANVRGNFVYLYHGTSPANMKKIIKSNKLKAGTWLTADESVARRYGLATIRRGEPAVSIYGVYAGSILVSGLYFTTNADLYLHNGVYVPKELIGKNLFANGGIIKEVVYHGSEKRFETFEKNKIGTSSNKTVGGWGFYFSNKYSVAKEYALKGGSVITAHIKGDYFDLDEPLSQEDIITILKLVSKDDRFDESDIEQLKTDYFAMGDDGYEVADGRQFLEYMNAVLKEPELVSEFIQRIGYSGNIFRDRWDSSAINYVVFNSEDIKIMNTEKFNEGGEISDTLSLAKINLSKKFKGDKLLDYQDLLEELYDNGAEIDEDGAITLYHRTNEENKNNIEKTGKMKGLENGIFFSTKETGQAEGYGNYLVKLKVPVEFIQLDDTFGNEAHVRIPTKKAGSIVDVKKYLQKSSDSKTTYKKGGEIEHLEEPVEHLSNLDIMDSFFEPAPAFEKGGIITVQHYLTYGNQKAMSNQYIKEFGELKSRFEQFYMESKKDNLTSDFAKAIQDAVKGNLSRIALLKNNFNNVSDFNMALFDAFVFEIKTKMILELEGHSVVIVPQPEQKEEPKLVSSFEDGGVIPETTGDSFATSADFLIFNDYKKWVQFIGEPYLVHAEVAGKGVLDGIRFFHSWVEDDQFIYSYSNGEEIILPKKLYYETADVKKDDTEKYLRISKPDLKKHLLKNDFSYGFSIGQYKEGALTSKGEIVETNADENHSQIEDKMISLPDAQTSFSRLKEILANQGVQIMKTVEDEFKDGGVVVGKRHSESDENGTGEKFIVESTGQLVELEGGEIVLASDAMSSDKKYKFEGKEMTGREIASELNHRYGGVKFDDGGKIDCGCNKYYYGGELPSATVDTLKGGEAVVNYKASQSDNKYEFADKEMTPREILSKINAEHGGKKF